MKKFLLILVITSIFLGCSTSVNDNSPNFHLELLPIESAVFPTQFVKNQVYEIPISYVRPTTCYIFEGFNYDKNLNTRTIAIQTSVLEQSNCTTPIQNPIQEILKFKATTETSYIFKLWKGKDAAGANVFQEITVTVVQ
jgi:hypothetical protein